MTSLTVTHENEVGECGEDGTAQHVVISRLLPQRWQVASERRRARPNAELHPLNDERHHV